MKRFALLFSAVLTLLLIALPALAVNLHNGTIVVHNKTSDTISVWFEHSWSTGHFMQEANIAPGGTFITSACCFAAGSPYRMRTYRHAPAPMGGNLTHFSFTPHLCNRDGIPYGYAVIVVTQANRVEEIDRHSCYEGPR